jgi:hypothetical protein
MASGLGTPAHAQLNQRVWGADAGVFAAYHFDFVRGGHFGLGLEVRVLKSQEMFGCGETTSTFAGGVGRITLVGWDQLRLMAGPQGGRNGAFHEVNAELAGGYRFGRDPGFVLQPSIGGALLSMLHGRLSYALPSEPQLALGLRTPSVVQPGCYSVGRPLRQEDEQLLGQRAPLPGVQMTSADSDDARAAAAACWAQRAAAEWASVPAFFDLADQLRACGAPPALSARAHQAADDEVRHALLAAIVAADLGAGALTLAPASAPRPAVQGRAGLTRLAAESWLDGCLGEGLAAAFAATEAQLAEAPAIRAAQAQIARDEAAHAALAWDVLAWTMSADRANAAAALAAAAASPSPPHAPTPDLARFGCLAPAAAPQLIAAQRADAHQRLRYL